jgi:hypothetical protein
MGGTKAGRRVVAGSATTASAGSRAAAGAGLTKRRAVGPRPAGRTRARCRVLGRPMPAVGAAAARNGDHTGQAPTADGEAAGGPLCGAILRHVPPRRTRAGRRVPSLMPTAGVAARHGGRTLAGSALSLTWPIGATARHGGRTLAGSALSLTSPIGATARHGDRTGQAGTADGEAAGGPLCGAIRHRARPGRTRAGRRVLCGATRRRVPVGTAPANGTVLPQCWTGRSYTTGHNGVRTVGFLT